MKEEERLTEAYKLLDYFRVNYKNESIITHGGNNGMIFNNGEPGEECFHKCFIGSTVNNVIDWVAKITNKEVEYLD